MKRALQTLALASSIVLAVGGSRAEDIDLFVQPPGVSVGLPNVLIILDNTGNWSTPFNNEIAALSSTLSGLAVNDDGSAKFRLGLMMFSETGNPNVSPPDGGYIRVAIRDLTEENKTNWVNLVNSFNSITDRSNAGKGAMAMAEAYQYYSGLAPFSGSSKAKTDFPKPTGSSYRPLNTAATLAFHDQPGNALTAFNGNTYTSPLVSGSCGGNYIIYISNGPVQDPNSDNTKARNELLNAANAVGLNGAAEIADIPISPAGSMVNMADEWARFMKKSPRRITTYTIDVDKRLTGQGPGWTALLKSMASVSDGKYFDVSSGINAGEEIEKALGQIFSEIQAVNSVFSSVSLPVSVNTEGTYLNQLYVGMFRPDADALPRWTGNLKQYKLGLINNEIRTLDADGESAINSSTGFISECARSFWTPTTADSYWAFRPRGGCTISGTSYDNSNSPDGNVVEKGGEAYVRRSSTTRTIRTCLSAFGDCSAPGALIVFQDANVPKGTPGLGDASMTDATRTAYVNWARGTDNLDENINANLSEMRPSVHGDVVHSRPVAINYGTNECQPVDDPTECRVVVYYGGNDGVLRAINGNRDAPIGSVAAGQEIWSFIPPEFFPQIKRLRDNNVQVNYMGLAVADDSPTPLPKPYGMDGPITAHDTNWLYVGMRRGGRVLYAFDVTGIVADTPVAPRLLWKRGCPNADNDTDCSTGFADIGQTWSAARPMQAEGYTGPMLIFGGGYDPCEDADVPTDACKASGKGHRIYVVDAETGDKLKEFTTDRGVIGDVFVIKDNSGNAMWAYAADLGGNLYRLSGVDANTPFADTDPEEWTITRIASLGCPTAGGCASNRKFMFMPDIVEKDGTYYLLLGSGDREKPLPEWAWPETYNVTNYFFMVKDQPANEDWLEDELTNCGDEIMCLDSLLEITELDPDADALAEKKGWYLPLNPHEQVVTSAITVFGTTTFSTHVPVVPVEGQCTSNLGTARVYNIRFLNAAPRVGQDRSAIVSGGGLPPSPVAGMVTLDDGQTYPFIIGADPDSPLEGRLPPSPSTGTQPKSLTYWYLEK
jgi:type IV pilus assembly protein PilY1